MPFITQRSDGLLSELVWEVHHPHEEDVLYVAHLDTGDRLTVLYRQTGYSDDHFDTESGYLGATGDFWLASGDKDVRNNFDFTVQQAIGWIKQHANERVGD